MDATRSQRVSRSNLRQGAVFLLVGLIWGIVVPSTPFPRLALGAHIQLTGSGVLFLVAGLVISHLGLGSGKLSAAILIAGPWFTWLMALSEMANAWWGTRQMLPIAAGQAGASGGTAWQEAIVTIAHVSAAVVLIVYWATILAALFQKPRSLTSDP